MTRRALAVLALIALACPSAAEECEWFPGIAGIVKADLDGLLLADTSTSPPTALADPGITLTAWGAGGLRYELAALPDAAPGSGDSYLLTFEYLGVPYGCSWPFVAQSLQPQAVSHLIAFAPSARLLEMAVGDLLPFAEARVSGLTSDPTGAAITFSLVDSAGGAVIDAAVAELADAAPYAGFDQNGNPATLWRALLRYRWAAGDTDLAGDYTYSFRITFPGSPPRPMTFPPPRSWPARIHP